MGGGGEEREVVVKRRGAADRPRDLLEEFLASRRARGCARGTVRFYRDCLRRFIAGYPRLPTRPQPIDDFMGSLTCGDERAHGYFRALKCFYRFLRRRHGLPNPMEDMDPPRRRGKVPKTLELGDLVLALARSRDELDRGILTLLIDTGIRCGEAAGRTLDDLGPEHILVDGKTGEREVPCSPETIALLERCAKQGVIFVGQRGPLTPEGLYKRVKKVLARAGIKGRRCSPHTLRHTFARWYIKAGGDIFSLQKILGHTSINMVRRYVELWGHDVALAHHRYTPLRQLPAAMQGTLFGAGEGGAVPPPARDREGNQLGRIATGAAAPPPGPEGEPRSTRGPRHRTSEAAQKRAKGGRYGYTDGGGSVPGGGRGEGKGEGGQGIRGGQLPPALAGGPPGQL